MTTSIAQSIRSFSCSATPLHYDACGQLISPDGFCHFPRTADYHVLILVLEGTLYFTSNHMPHEIHAGEYIFLRAGEEHHGHKPSDGKLSYLWVHIPGEYRFEPDQTPQSPYHFAEKGDTGEGTRVQKQFYHLLNMSLEEPALPSVMMDYACC